MTKSWCGLVLVLAVGCGGGSTESTQTAPASTTPTSGGESSAVLPPETPPVANAAGQTHDTPIEACGAMESYQRVADYTCSDGVKPLAGDARRGMQARSGSTSPHMEGASMMESHIVDLYEVPCSSGPVEVYVCLYHCPPGRSPM